MRTSAGWAAILAAVGATGAWGQDPEVATSSGNGWLIVLGAVAVIVAIVAARQREAARHQGGSSLERPVAAGFVPTPSRSSAGGLRLAQPCRPQTPEELRRMCDRTQLHFVVSDSGACVFGFRAEHVPDGVLVVAKINRNGTWVAIYGTVLEAVQHPGKALMRRLMELNESLWQGKFSIASTGNIDFQFECPTDTLDVQELTECIHACAKVIDDHYDELRRLA